MHSACKVHSAVLNGVEAMPVSVEVAVSGGLPGIIIVGMPDTAVQEARERVRGAIKAANYSMPSDKIVINLAPSSLKKTGSGFDLPIVVGVLVATGQVNPEILNNRLFVGELSLDGNVRSVAGTLAYGICAYKRGMSLVSAGGEAVPIDGLEHLSLRSVTRLHLEDPFEEVLPKAKSSDLSRESSLDFRDISGHEMAKRAAQIAVAGEHGILMVGPPGSGKTMLASRIGTIMPPLEQEEMLEAAVVHSVAGESIDSILSGQRPFRQPHHSATTAGLVGGGSPIRPGEVSLAHCGTLFLDELAEFKSSSLQALRQPIESGKVCITRADGNINFPASFMLVAAANPCPCGYLGDDEKPCTCTVPQIRKYQGRIGGPLLDRIDLQLDVRRIPPNKVLDSGNGTDSATLREGVIKAREFMQWRNRSEEDKGASDSISSLRRSLKRSSSKEIIESCNLCDEAYDFIVSMAEAYSLSGRGLISVLRVGRTIADMEESMDVKAQHLAEALGFRLREGIGDR